MSLDTLFEVWPNCLLALPTLLATDFTSMSARLAFPIERGSGTPRIFLRRVRLLSTKPPATPAAAAPTASTGPLGLLAAFLSVPSMPLPFWLALLRLAPPPPRELDLLWLWAPRVAPFAREREPLVGREALRRLCVDGDDFDREEPPEERGERLRDEPRREREDPLASVFEPEPFDELLLRCPLLEAALPLAIPHRLSIEIFPPVAPIPAPYTSNPISRAFRRVVQWGREF
jgi:hypothetical protein